MMNEYLAGHSTMDKRSKVYIRLESESSIHSEDTESIDSIQNRETEFAQDTADTDSYFEFEVDSLSEENDEAVDSNSSSGADDIYVTEEVIAAVLGDTSLEAWAADAGEDSCTSTTDTEEISKTYFWTCAQCKSKNNNPLFRLCQKCFQVRKNFNPLRPKRCKKRKTDTKTDAVNVDNLRSCLSGLSQDSGVGSSQELASLNFTEIKVPEHLNTCSTSSGISTNGSSISTKDSESGREQTTSRKRKASDSFSDNEVRPKKFIIEGPIVNALAESSERINDRTNAMDLKELCMMCNNAKKDGVFLHGKDGHQCCCYKCAKKTWKTTKKCPICNRRIKDVIKLFC